jgi:UDP-N-acetylmuramyl pentapeptide phosphotransferase/UDP-N-acetylglucosamine-1-phosphate transferase
MREGQESGTRGRGSVKRANGESGEWWRGEEGGRMSRKGVRIPIVGRRVPKIGLVLLVVVALVVLVVTISRGYPHKYFNPHVISFIVLALWCGWTISILWDDLQIQSHRKYRIFRLVYFLALVCMGLVAIALKNPQLRSFYLLTSLAILMLFVLWKRRNPDVRKKRG